MNAFVRGVEPSVVRLTALAAAAVVILSIGVVATASLDLGSLGEPRFGTADLETIVTSPSTPPEGTDHVETAHGVAALIRGIHSYDVPRTGGEVIRLGFIDAVTQSFAAETAENQPWGYLLSSAAVFETAEGARDALRVVRDSWTWASPDWASPEAELGLGDDAVHFVYVADNGLLDSAYLWRSGNLLLLAFASGDVDREELRAMVEGMNSRADR